MKLNLAPLAFAGVFARACILALLPFAACTAVAKPAMDEDVVAQARAMDKEHRSTALTLLESRLALEPRDNDARILYGAMLSWDGRYDEARRELNIVIAANPENQEALAALINVEMWADHPDRAERLARRGLEQDPENPRLLLARAKALRAMKRLQEAKVAAAAAVCAAPGNREAADLRESIDDSLRVWRMSLTHTADWFSDGRTPWREDQLELAHSDPRGQAVARFSDAGRSGEQSRQAEIDYYPHLGFGRYAFLNAGYSPDARFYPRYRLGADIFQNIGHGLELSAGYRRIAFGSGMNIYTVALTRYYGQWMVAGRAYLTPDSLGASHAAQITLRRYFSRGRNYCTVRGGWGSAPAGVHSITDIGILSSRAVALELAHDLGRRLSLVFLNAVSQQDRALISGLYDVTISGRLYFRF